MEILQQAGIDLDRYPPEAYSFLKEGLDFTVRRVHGRPPAGWGKILAWMHRHEVSPEELRRRYDIQRLPAGMMRLLGKLGGPEALEKRHVCGRELSLGLAELARLKWGFMASVVLAAWNVRTTHDFGEMVFALIRAGLLQKKAEDSIEDFDDVFDFEEAFDRGYQIRVPVHF